jgi:hypothetical protein
MASFRDLLIRLNEQNETPDDAKAMVVIRKGLSLNRDFWENFKEICNYSDGLAELLDLSPESKVQIATKWRSRIEQVEQKVKESDNSTVGEKKATVISTGNEPIRDTNPRAGGPGNLQGTTEDPRM